MELPNGRAAGPDGGAGGPLPAEVNECVGGVGVAWLGVHTVWMKKSRILCIFGVFYFSFPSSTENEFDLECHCTHLFNICSSFTLCNHYSTYL